MTQALSQSSGRASRVPGDEPDLSRALESASRYVQEYQALATERFGPSALGVIDLPPLSEAPIVGGQLKVAATLFWAQAVEAAGLPSFVERLVGIGPMARPGGAINAPAFTHFAFGPQAALLLRRYAKGENQRFRPEERQAYYARVFARPFPAAFEALVSRLSEHGRQAGNMPARTEGIAAAAQSLAQLLSGRSQGLVTYAADDIVRHIREALAILRHPQVKAALGAAMGGGPLSLIQRHAPIVLGHPLDPFAMAGRASAGAAIIAWVAGASSQLSGAGRLLLPRGANVVHAAERWRALGDGAP